MDKVTELAIANRQRSDRLIGAIPPLNDFAIVGDPLTLLKVLKKTNVVKIDLAPKKIGTKTLGIVFAIDRLKKLTKRGQRLALAFFKVHDNSSGLSGFLFEMGVYLTIKNNQLIIKPKEMSPAFNLPLFKEIMRAKNIDLSNNKSFFNPYKYLANVTAAVADSSLSVSKVCALVEPDMYNWTWWTEKDLTKIETLRRIDEKKSSLTPTYSLSNELVYPFAKAFDILADQRCLAAISSKKVFTKLFLSNLILKEMQDKHNILIAAKDDKDAQALIRNFTDSPLKKLLPRTYVGNPAFYLPKEVHRIIATPTATPIANRTKLKDEFANNHRDYLAYTDAVNGLGTLETGEDILTGINKFSHYHSRRKESFEIDVTDYAEKDYDRDQAFFKRLADNNYMAKGPLRAKPLHSLKIETNTKQMYEALHKSLEKTREDLFAFTDALKNAKVGEWRLGKIDCLDDYRKKRESIVEILKYNGFPLTLFKVAKNKDALPLAWRISATKDQIDSLFEMLSEYVKNVNLLSEPLKKYMKQTGSKHLSVRLKGRRKLIKLLRRRRDYKSFVTSLKEYIKNTEAYRKDLLEGERVFGLSLYAEDGPKQMTEVLEYIDAYEKALDKYPALNRQKNKFVARIFADFDFREEVREKLRTADLALDTLEDDFTGLADFFADDFQQDARPLADLLQMLTVKCAASWTEFVAYEEFVSAVTQASSALKEALAAADAVNVDMKNFPDDYWYSLYKALAKQRYRQQDMNLYETLKNLKAYLPYWLPDLIDQSVETRKRDTRLAWWNSPDGERARETSKYAPFALSADFLTYYWPLTSLICPLQILTAEQLPVTTAASFDCVVISDSKRFKDEDLYLLLSKGAKVVLLYNGEKEVDPRIKGYPRAEFNLTSLYEGPLNYKILSKDFLNLLAFGFEENGYELETAKESHSPMPLSYIGKDGFRRCVIPSCLIDQRHTNTLVFGTNSILLSLGLKPLVIIESMPLVVDPKEVVKKADQEAKRFAE